MRDPKEYSVPSKLIAQLQIIIFLKVFGFLALSESGGVNKAFKVVVALMMTAWIVVVTRKLLKEGYVFKFKYVHTFVLIFYLAYLILGIISISWAGDYIFATVQIFRDMDLLIFALLFIRVMRAVNDKHETNFDLSYFLMYAIFINALYFMIGNWTCLLYTSPSPRDA